MIQRHDHRRRVARSGVLDGDADHGARLQIHGVPGLVGQTGAAVLHLRDLRVRVLRMPPIVVGPFLRTLAVEAGQLGAGRRRNAGGAGGPLPDCRRQTVGAPRRERRTAAAEDSHWARGTHTPSRSERLVDMIRNITVDGEDGLEVDTAEELGRALLTGLYVLASDEVRAEYGLTDIENSDTHDIVDRSDWRDDAWRAEGGR